MSKNSLLSYYTRSLRFETSIVHFHANGSATENIIVRKISTVKTMLTVSAIIGFSM